MAHRPNEHHHHEHAHQQKSWLSQAHKDWRTWLAVGLMLAGMAIYIFSMDESIEPGGAEQPPVPAAP